MEFLAHGAGAPRIEIDLYLGDSPSYASGCRLGLGYRFDQLLEFVFGHLPPHVVVGRPHRAASKVTSRFLVLGREAAP